MANQITFMEIDAYPCLSVLADSWQMIRDEYLEIKHLMRQWPEQYLHNGLWFTVPLIFNKQEMSHAKNAPKTFDLVRDIPGVFIAGFSVMKPGAFINPHFGYTRKVLRSHLGLVCNDAAFIQVGNDRKCWREGEVFIFDDTARHYAANPGHADRVVLIVDFERGTL